MKLKFINKKAYNAEVSAQQPLYMSLPKMHSSTKFREKLNL